MEHDSTAYWAKSWGVLGSRGQRAGVAVFLGNTLFAGLRLNIPASLCTHEELSPIQPSDGNLIWTATIIPFDASLGFQQNVGVQFLDRYIGWVL